MKKPAIRLRACSQGSALLIVLAFLLLLTTLIVAFLSRATFERQLSNASFSQGKVDLAGQGAINAIICDLQQEIVAGSNGTGTPTLASGFLYPNSSATAVPALVVPSYTTSTIVGTGMENLIKISYPSPFWPSSGYSTAGPQRASSVSSYNSPSLNYRLITPARWNKPVLMNPTDTSFDPPSGFTTPDWIYVARDGSNPTTWDTGGKYESISSVSPTTIGTAQGQDAVTQRYAYAIYDEGGTLDLNVAGSPVTGTSGSPVAVTYSTNQPYKNALPYADLTQLPYVSAVSAAQQEVFVNAIVGWRNFATSLLGNSNIFPNTYSFPAQPSTSLADFDQNVIFNPGGFMTVSGPVSTSFVISGTTSTINDGPQNGPNFKGTRNQSDNAFASRQQLLQFFLQGLGQNSTFTSSTGSNLSLASLEQLLPYFGTFSRDISQPSYASPVSFASSTAPTLSNNTGTGGNSVSTASGFAPGVDALINPAFLAVTVGSNSGTSGWTRNNGATAIAGEPLVKKRFALMRLAWLTYNGPSYNRNGVKSGTTAASTAGGSDYDIYLMENTYGIPASFLLQGTSQNIYNYFGLSWVPDPNNSGSYEWAYSHSGAYATSSTSSSILTSASSLSTATAIKTLTSVAGLSSTLAREPDFFEILKAGLCVGSIGKAYTASYNLYNATPQLSPADYYGFRDQDVDNQIIQIGANIISQYQPSGYPARILFNDGVFASEPSTPAKQFTTSIVEHRGVVDLPYIYGVQESKLRAADSTPTYTSCPVAGTVASGKNGTAVDLQVPVIWNPHAWTSTSDNSDGDPRPTSFRIYAETCDPTYDATGNNPDPTKVISLNTAWRSASGSGGEQTYHSGDAVATAAAQPLTVANSAMTFSIPQSDNYLFREPTLLNKPSIPTGSSLAIDTTSTGASNFIKTLFSANYITSLDQSPYYSQVSVSPADNYHYIGVVLGGCTLPLAWTENLQVGEADQTNPSSATNYAVPAEYTSIISGNYITYRLQYKDTNSNWITYDEKYGPILCATDYNFWNLIQGTGPGSSKGGWGYMFASNNSEIISNELGAICFDPRTSRWGMNYAGRNGIQSDDSHTGLTGPVGAGGSANPGWAAPVTGASAVNVTNAAEQNAIWSARPDENRGFILSVPNNADGLAYGYNTGPVAAGWYPAPLNGNISGGYSTAVIPPGLTCQNNLAVYLANSNELRFTGDGAGSVTSFGLGCYADPDGVVRRGMAAYVPPTSTIPASTAASGASAASGIPFKPAYTFPTANSATLTPGPELSSRPIMINRPFRSVADIGHVFSDTPWRNLDFSTPESGNPGFLDIFCINDTNDPNGLVAGKVDLNTRQAPVLRAILAGAYKDEFGTVPALPGSSATSSVATASVIATGLVSRTTGSTNLVNIGDLVGKWSSSVTNSSGTSPNWIDGSQSYIGFSGTQTPVSTTIPPSTPANLSNLLYTDVNSNGTVAAYDTNNVNRMREVAVRALANSGMTRVWNLMIDVIAQTGRFPSSASSLANFNVEGERRYWVHVAIDRYTGKVLDEQVEEVKE